MTKSAITKLLRSGNFTIVYWDREEPTLYKCKFEKDKEYERDEYETMNKSIVELDCWNNGYCPNIVALLAHALGGNADSA